MKTVDFLFLYEVKNRELENICLLKYEIERRGYSSEIINTWQYLYKEKPEIFARVVVVFAIYNNEVFEFIKQYVYSFEKIVNLQWEQLFSNKDERNRNSYYNVTGIAKKATHISWGKRNYNRLVDYCHVPAQNVKICGHITLDFLREDFNGYYKKRENLLSQYNINTDKKIILFISSFVTPPDKDIEQIKASKDSVSEMKKISFASQEILMRWVGKILDEDHDSYFIYRPHPAEIINNKILDRMKRKYKNFLIISDHSVKQWIKIVDNIFTWYSTSIIEIYAANKTCQIVRPIKIPSDLEIQLYENARIINNFNNFKRAFKFNSEEFPIDERVINEIYDIKQDLPSYIRICNVMEEVLKTENATFQMKPPKQNYSDIIINMFYSFLMNKRLIGFLKFLSQKNQFINNNQFCERLIYQFDMIKTNSTSDKEINYYVKKIAYILKKRKM